uniref:Uncharacterized protein n=2 Tax=Aegilops tauschii subsp. strangulata TaxID=200361 RepID=A0A453M1M2_AEGTS
MFSKFSHCFNTLDCIFDCSLYIDCIFRSYTDTLDCTTIICGTGSRSGRSGWSCEWRWWSPTWRRRAAGVAPVAAAQVGGGVGPDGGCVGRSCG